jgi:formylglycine-generating enzyme required for sulfatase activity
MHDKIVHKRMIFLGLSIFLSLLLTLKSQEHKNESGEDNLQDNSKRSSFALVIGIDHYKKWPVLKNAANDALKVAKELEERNFVVTYRINPKLKKLKVVIEDFFKNKEFDDKSSLFIWYSGYGYTYENNAFLVPTDAPMWNAPNFKEKALRVSDIHKLVTGTKAKDVYMVFDSCFPQMPLVVEEDKNNLQDIFDVDLILKKSRQILCSCIGGGGKYRPGDGNFRELFIKAIRNEENADANGDYYLTATEIGRFIEKKLKDKMTPNTDINQAPAYGKLKGFAKGESVFLLSERTHHYFQDDLICNSKGPEMVKVPAGYLIMGDLNGEGNKSENPVHLVKMEKFAVSRYEITFKEYDLFCENTSHRKPGDNDWGRGDRPVINVSLEDAIEYTKWLTEQIKDKKYEYRLPTEAEWEYMARAGTNTNYWWGNEIGKNNACCGGCGAEWGWDAKEKMTAPVGSFGANQFGIYDTVGNVWEWTCSEYTDTYIGKEKECLEEFITGSEAVVIRGGAWDENAKNCRVSLRSPGYPGERSQYIGFRVIRH